MSATSIELSKAIKTAIDKELKKYPHDQRQSAVLAALKLVQQKNGYLTPAAMDAVAAYLTMPPVMVYEVATFYSMYELAPVGCHKIGICNSISCLLRGSQRLIQHVKQRYGVDLNQTTADGKFTLKAVECLGACVGAPVVQIDQDYHEGLTPQKLEQLIDHLES